MRDISVKVSQEPVCIAIRMETALMPTKPIETLNLFEDEPWLSINSL